VVEAEGEGALADLSEMRDFEAVPGVDGGLVAEPFRVFLHERDPQVDVALVRVVDALQVLPHLEGLAEVNAALLVPPVAHHWIVGIAVVLGSEAIVVLCGEDTARLARSLLQQNQLHRKRTVVVVVPHRLHSDAVALESRGFRRQPLDGGGNFVEGGRAVVGLVVEELVGHIFEGGIASGVLEVGPRVIDGLPLDDVDALAEHLLAVVVEPLQIGLFGLSHLPFQLELPPHLLEPHHLDLVLELLAHARHLLELLELDLIELALLGELRQKVECVVLLRHQRFDEDVLIALPLRVQTLKQSLLLPRKPRSPQQPLLPTLARRTHLRPISRSQQLALRRPRPHHALRLQSIHPFLSHWLCIGWGRHILSVLDSLSHRWINFFGRW